MIYAGDASGHVLAYDAADGRSVDVQAFDLPAPLRAMAGWGENLYMATEGGLVARPARGGAVAPVNLGGASAYGLWAVPSGLWVATDQGMMVLRDAGRGDPTGAPHVIAGSGGWGHITCVCPAGDAVLIGTTAGLLVCETDGRIRAFHDGSSGLGAASIGAIAVCGDQVCLGTLGGGLTVIKLAALNAMP